MRQSAKVLAIAVTVAATCWTTISEAAFFSYPMALRYQFDRIAFEEPTLAPIAHTVFCMRYRNDCEVQKVERLDEFCGKRGHTLLELAFSWLAANPMNASIIAGATKPEQIEQNVKAVDWALSSEDLAEIDRVTKSPIS